MKETKVHEWIYRRKKSKAKTGVLRIPKEIIDKLEKGNYVIRIYKLEMN
jgi:hypothetical protein